MDISNPSSPQWDKVTLETLLFFLNDTGVSRAVLLAVYSWNNTPIVMPTHYVLEAYRRHPDRLIPFCALDVREPFFEEEARLYIDMGCEGFGEYTSKVPINHRANLKLFNICAKFEVPVLIHVAASENDPYGALDPDLMELERAVRKFDNVNFIMHGPGWWRHISADAPLGISYPQGSIGKAGRAVFLLESYPNVYGDLSAFSGYNALQRDLDFSRKFLEKLNSKLLYGTDLEAFFTSSHSLLNLLRSMNLGNEVYRNIFYRNMERLLR